jgi:sirohydrochlorin cobaltochelatase
VRLRNLLQDSLRDSPFRIGEIVAQQRASGAIVLSHRDDIERQDLRVYNSPVDAAQIVRFDDAGVYRPLKTAPNLAHGWLLMLRDVEELRLALELFYPARVAAFAAHRAGELIPTTFRATLERQSGMYRVAATINDPQADALIGRFCRSSGGCLRTILWRRDPAGTVPSRALPSEKFDPAHDQTGHGERTMPLLCQEACNLLVAEARRVVKATH